ncbi:hypothetical protein [Natronomonas sp. LN261]|uniref:hypothetical protein n=1 Tax=Natronomonas sp. LN261 TaxID=2750669 RepID=UPI0015EE63D7|nr:hypothetical protein [Natronomonas sp. LN261]
MPSHLGFVATIDASAAIQPAFIGLLGELNLGSQVMAAATFFLLAWYILRAARIGSTIAAVSATAVQVSVSLFVVAAIAVGLGWVAPHPGAFLNDVVAAGRWALGMPLKWALEWLRSAFDQLGWAV